MSESFPIEQFVNPADYPDLRVSQHIITEVVRVLGREGNWLIALKLIRAAYRERSGACALLADAKEIFAAITKRQPWERTDV